METIVETGLLLRLLLAHIFSDFMLQPAGWVTHKLQYRERSRFLYFHILVTGALAYVATWHIDGWKISLLIMVTHYLIDLWKLYCRNNLFYFVADQLLHVLVIVLGWMIFYHGFNFQIAANFNWPIIWLYSFVFAFIIWPVGYFISFATASWRKKLEEDAGESLEQAGKYIGMLERILVMIFILTGRYETIGLLIAAKSILRFNESKARKHTEYVLIGTMLSFAITLVAGLAAQYYVAALVNK